MAWQLAPGLGALLAAAAAGGARGLPEPAGQWSVDGRLDGPAAPGPPGTWGFAAPEGERAACQQPATEMAEAVDTSRSFSVAAWVVLSDLGAERAVAVAQVGALASAYTLGFVGGNFALSASAADAAVASERHVWAPTAPEVGRPTHLVGVYDQAAGTLRLFVDGELAASAPAPRPMWRAPGPTWVGRGRAGGAAANDWPGDVEDVQVFGTALTPKNVDDLYHALDLLEGG